jgi:hypothetical protein
MKTSTMKKIIILLIMLYIVGWIMCVVKFVSCDFDTPMKAEVFYGLGVFTTLGGILGWFNFGK